MVLGMWTRPREGKAGGLGARSMRKHAGMEGR